jgi:hypothetical protein
MNIYKQSRSSSGTDETFVTLTKISLSFEITQ